MDYSVTGLVGAVALICSLLASISNQLIIRYPTTEIVLPNDNVSIRVATLGVSKRYLDTDRAEFYRTLSMLFR
jgi:hypothetical protein